MHRKHQQAPGEAEPKRIRLRYFNDLVRGVTSGTRVPLARRRQSARSPHSPRARSRSPRTGRRVTGAGGRRGPPGAGHDGDEDTGDPPPTKVVWAASSTIPFVGWAEVSS